MNRDGIADTHEKLVSFGVRVSFTGHDLRIIRGQIIGFISVGDRGFHVETEGGEIHQLPGEGGFSL